jgi:exopolysaccharide biosynthesis polyprenyl glycosylphosphotransferase
VIVSRDRPMRGLVLALDALLVIAAIALAAGLHAALRDHVALLKQPPSFGEYASIVYLSVPLWLVLTAAIGLHRTFERMWTRRELIWDLAKLHLAGLLGLSAAMFLTQSVINRSLVTLFLGCSLLLSYLARITLAMWLRYQHRTGQSRTRILIVGDDTPAVRNFLSTAEAAPRPPVIVGQLGNQPVATVTQLGTIAELSRVLEEQALDRVLLFPPFHETEQLRDAVAACETVGVAAEVAIDISTPSKAPPRVLDLYGRPFISFDAAPKAPDRLALKHGFDWAMSAIGLVVLAPLFLAVSAAILVTMGRPIFFSQRRAGLFGRQFAMIKFRTMIADAEARQSELAAQNEMSGPVFKIKRDPRVTRLGWFLRRTSIDELPQLVNVFLGQMSLVGPRPLPIKEQQAIRGWHRRRLSMKPGITGIWQISGRSNIDFEEWMRLDQSYVDQWSLGKDLRILLRTIPVVLLGRGAR